MADLVEEIYFNGGLDSDSDEKFIRQGDYLDAINVTQGEDSNSGILVNIKGNEIVYTPAGVKLTSLLCGWTFYNKNESIILFLWEYSDQTFTIENKIVEFNPQTGIAIDIINDLVLGFIRPDQNDYFIDADMIDDWLSWTDNTNPLRMVNVQDVKADSPTIDLDYLNVARISPLYSPVISFERDVAITNNKIVDDAFQFKTQYVYKDYRKSVWGGASDALIDTLLVNQYSYFDLSNSNNYIAVSFNSGATEVRFINIATRTSFDSAWKLVIKIDKETSLEAYATPTSVNPVATPLSDDTTYYYKFYNSGQYTPIALTETLQPYDAVPLLSESVSAIGENQFVWGGNTEGKDAIELDVTVTPNYGSNTEYFQTWDINTVGYVNGGGSVVLTVSFDASDLDDAEYHAGDIIELQANYTIGGTTEDTLTIQVASTVVFDGTYTGSTAIATYIEANVSNPTGTSSPNGVAANPVTTSLVGDVVNFIATWAVETGTGAQAGVVNNSTIVILADAISSTIKRGENKKLALIYYDGYGRKWPALTSADCDTYIKNYNENSTDTERGKVSLEWSISHTAPLAAAYYRWAYTPINSSFIQVGCTNAQKFKLGDLFTPMLALQLSSLDYLLGAEDTSVFNYTFEAGDTIKVLQNSNFLTPTVRTYLTEDRRYTVTGVYNGITNHDDATYTGLWITITPDNEFNWTNQEEYILSGFTNAVLEVSKKVEQGVEVYNEVGEFFTCTNGTHSQTTGTVANGYAISIGDVWNRMRKFYTAFGVGAMETNVPAAITPFYYFLVEDPYPSDFLSKKSYGLDLPNFLYPETREKYDNTIRISNKFFQDTQINGLSSFDLVDSDISQAKIDISDSYGRIKGLEQLGDSLVIICEEKVLSSFIGATEYTDVQGNVNVVKSTKSLGYARAHAEKYGTFMKESIVNNGKYIYFFDLFNGAVVRKSANGLFPISGKISTAQGEYDYKMRTFFKNISDNLIDSLYDGSVSVASYDSVKCFMGFDPYYENIYITFKDTVNTDNSISLIFSESSNRWISKYTSYVAAASSTLYPFTKNNIFSHFGKYLYKLNSDNVDRCNLYSVAQDSFIQFVSHAAPNQVKIFNAIGIHADSEYIVDPIEIPASLNYPNGMESKIPAANFDSEEGVQRSEFLRNMKSRSSVATNYDLINGEAVRGKVVKIKMTNSDTDKIELHKVDISSEISK